MRTLKEELAFQKTLNELFHLDENAEERLKRQRLVDNCETVMVLLSPFVAAFIAGAIAGVLAGVLAAIFTVIIQSFSAAK